MNTTTHALGIRAPEPDETPLSEAEMRIAAGLDVADDCALSQEECEIARLARIRGYSADAAFYP